MPKLLALSCNHCGAPLDVPPRAKYVTCAHCATRLKVMKTENAAYTEILEEVMQKTQEVADDVAVLTLQGELDRIDRSWEKRRENFMISDKHGHKHVPSTFNTVGTGAFGGVIMLIWVGFSVSSGMPKEMAMIVGGIACLVVGSAIIGFGKVRVYEQEKAKYTRRRREKYRELRSAKQAAS